MNMMTKAFSDAFVEVRAEFCPRVLSCGLYETAKVGVTFCW
ncbi:hypothetical protein OAG34_00095 [bacterium]|nr:hypothetical protein [bacterium]